MATYDELHGSVLTTTRLYEFTDTEMQVHDEHIRKEERERVKEKLIEKITERGTAFDRVDVEVFFAQLEKEL